MASPLIQPDPTKYSNSCLLARTMMGLTYEAVLVSTNLPESISSKSCATNSSVIVKLLSIATVPPGCREELIVEYDACTKANCPLLAKINSVSFSPELALLTIECQKYSSSLQVLVNEAETGRLAPSRALEILTQIIYGLVYLHNPNKTTGLIIHRNIQPRNILLDDNGLVQISDFAFCRALTAVSLMNPQFSDKKFMSPEAAQDLPLDEKTDIWSLGCLIIYMLTGNPPTLPINVGMDDSRVIAAVTTIINDVRSSIQPTLPEEELYIFDFLVSTAGICMAFDALDRPAATDLCEMKLFQDTWRSLTQRYSYLSEACVSLKQCHRLAIDRQDKDEDQIYLLECLKQGIIDNNLTKVREHIDTFDEYPNEMMDLAIEHRSYLVLPMLCRRIVERNLIVSVKLRQGEVVSERTNLMKAAWDGDTEGVKRHLHEAGKLWYDDTALMRAARGGNLHCVKLLLCEMGIQSSSLMTSLMYTAQKGHIECLKYLLAESRYRDKANITALIIAVRAGYPECVRLLKDRENDLVGDDGKTAYEHACEMPFPFISEGRYRRCAKMLAPSSGVK